MSYNKFEEKARRAISEMKSLGVAEATVVHHDDADGLCSAAITKKALEREGFKVKTFCLEKIYPEVVQSLHEEDNRLIFYVDIGSAHADYISECNKGRNLTIILDHHDPKPATDPKVYDLNLEHYGFKGETDFSGATCCYLFAKTLNPINTDLSYLAIIGSCEIPSGFLSLNKAVLEEALKNGIIKPVRKTYEIAKFGIRVDKFFSVLQILGAAGYYEGGPALGIEACLNGLNEKIEKKVEELENRRKTTNKRLLAILYRQRLKETEHIQWFDAGDLYKGMGSKVIGQFCSFLSYQARLVKPDKYIVGFMNLQPEIPGWGRLKQTLAKASVRTPKALKKLIEDGKMPGAVEVLVEASKGFGIADGHQYAANVVLPRDMKEKLIENAERYLKSRF